MTGLIGKVRTIVANRKIFFKLFIGAVLFVVYSVLFLCLKKMNYSTTSVRVQHVSALLLVCVAEDDPRSGDDLFCFRPTSWRQLWLELWWHCCVYGTKLRPLPSLVTGLWTVPSIYRLLCLFLFIEGFLFFLTGCVGVGVGYHSTCDFFQTTVTLFE